MDRAASPQSWMSRLWRSAWRRALNSYYEQGLIELEGELRTALTKLGEGERSLRAAKASLAVAAGWGLLDADRTSYKLDKTYAPHRKANNDLLWLLDEVVRRREAKMFASPPPPLPEILWSPSRSRRLVDWLMRRIRRTGSG